MLLDVNFTFSCDKDHFYLNGYFFFFFFLILVCIYLTSKMHNTSRSSDIKAFETALQLNFENECRKAKRNKGILWLIDCLVIVALLIGLAVLLLAIIIALFIFNIYVWYLSYFLIVYNGAFNNYKYSCDSTDFKSNACH